MEIRIIKAEDYTYYEESLVTLYIDLFSSGESFQYHNKNETQNYLQSIFEVGYGVFAIEKNQLAGALLLTPLSFDNLLPNDITKGFDLNHSIYVAEMMVEKTQQGRGIGKKLLLHFLENVDKKTYTDAFIRVWVENKAALGLYKKVGFKACASIVQSKLLADKIEMFDFKKIYLHQKLK
jgi:ribosomal protein S18 acetylase RimI-like enzyme